MPSTHRSLPFFSSSPLPQLYHMHTRFLPSPGIGSYHIPAAFTSAQVCNATALHSLVHFQFQFVASYR